MGLFRVERTWYLDMECREGGSAGMTLIFSLSRKKMESFRSQQKVHVQCGEGELSGSRQSWGHLLAVQVQGEGFGFQENQDVREDREQSGKPDCGVDSLLIPTKSSGTFFETH